MSAASAERPPKPGGVSFLLELPGLLLAALVVAILIKTFLIQPFYIPSESMVHTLEINDRVMVSKLSYRFGGIERGDVVVFETGPALEQSGAEEVVQAVLDALGVRSSGKEDLIKRVIAVGVTPSPFSTTRSSRRASRACSESGSSHARSRSTTRWSTRPTGSNISSGASTRSATTQ